MQNNVKSVVAFVSGVTKRFVVAACLPTETCVLYLLCVFLCLTVVCALCLHANAFNLSLNTQI